MVTICRGPLWELRHRAEKLNRGSSQPGHLGKRHGLDPTRWMVEHWIAKDRHSFGENLHAGTARWMVEHWIAKDRHNFVENLHCETAQFPGVRSARQPGPNVKGRLDQTVVGRRDLTNARRCLAGAIRDSNPPSQRASDGYQLLMRAGRTA